MVHYYYLAESAFRAVVNCSKTVEVRLKNKNVVRGDCIVFSEYQGSGKLCVYVDQVCEYENIYDLMQKIPSELWKFTPETECISLIKKEFIADEKDKESVLAIHFSLPKISVILPIYNSEKYLTATLESIEHQDFQNYEIIIVDDGSTDSSRKIVAEFEKHLPIRYFKNDKNSGAAYSRNRGITLANGSYLIFLDSDDLFEPILLSELYSAITKFNADIAVAEFDSIFNDVYSIKDFDFSSKQLSELTNKTFRYGDIPEYLRYLDNVPWNKLFKKSFITENELHFQDIPSSNDVYFCNIAMLLGNIIHVSSIAPLVHYRILRDNSISKVRNPFYEYEAYRYLFQEIQNRKLSCPDRLINSAIYGLFKYIRTCRADLKKEYFSFVKELLTTPNPIFSKDFINKHHPVIQKIFETCSIDDEVFKLKLETVELIYDREKMMNSVSRYQYIGIYKDENVYHLVSKLYKTDLHKIVLLDGKSQEAECVLCFSFLQKIELARFLKDNHLSDINIIELYENDK